jgi:hypothetical protein
MENVIFIDDYYKYKEPKRAKQNYASAVKGIRILSCKYQRSKQCNRRRSKRGPPFQKCRYCDAIFVFQRAMRLWRFNALQFRKK